MTLKKILCPTDFSPGSQQAARLATRLAREMNAELVFVHSWYVAPNAYSPGVPFPPGMEQDLMNDAQRGLDSAVNEALAGGAKQVSGGLVSGVPWAEIVAQLENQAFDLCVIGTHGRTGLARILVGSVAEKVIRHAPCPVLAVPPNSDANPFRSALVPTDFSETAMQALDLAGELVAPQGSITLLHVIEIPVSYPGGVADPDFARDLDRRAAAALDQEVARVKGKTSARIVGQSRIGAPGAQTLAMLEADHGIDLVVMGSHGRTGIKRALMGSVAEKVVRHARRPVVVARKRV
jgi:nucleotide-binding universal stress UspA family protein